MMYYWTDQYMILDSYEYAIQARIFLVSGWQMIQYYPFSPKFMLIFMTYNIFCNHDWRAW